MNELYHYGIPDQKWGVRRFQDYAGKLTAAGRERYGVGLSKAKSSIGTAKTLAKYSSVGVAATSAKRNLDRNIKYRVAPKVSRYSRKAKSYSDSVRDAASSRFDSAKKDVLKKSTSIGRQASRKLNNLEVQARMLGRDASYFSRITMNKLDRFLHANSREAARLRSYVDSDRFARYKKAALINLQQQSSYKARKAAGKNFVYSMGNIRAAYRVSSNTRLDHRSSVSGEQSGLLDGAAYRFFKEHGRSALARRAPALHTADRYADVTEKWRSNIEKHRKFAKANWDYARGR